MFIRFLSLLLCITLALPTYAAAGFLFEQPHHQSDPQAYDGTEQLSIIEKGLIAGGHTEEEAKSILAMVEMGVAVVSFGVGGTKAVIKFRDGKKPPVVIDATNNAEAYFGQQRRFWADDPVQFNGNRVYQRNDQFDPNQVSTWRENGQTVQGTNAERMATGRAPIGSDGQPINLHHMNQTQGGAIAEVTQTFHQQNFGTIHINTGGLPSGINRAEFDAWRADYWRNRASTLE